MQLQPEQQIASQSIPTTPSKKQTFLTDSKKDFQHVFKGVYLLASVFSAVLLRKVYLFQTLDEFKDVRKGTSLDFLYYSLPFGVAFTVPVPLFQLFDLAVHYLLDGFFEKYYLNETKYEGKARHRRSYTLVKWSYSIIYYMVSSGFGVYVLKDTSFFPTWLGGKGVCDIIPSILNLHEATHPMKLFYLFQFGKHFSRLFSHMFIKQQGNYYEYVLHHALSTFLIFFSYLTNQWLIGTMVLICHDISDLFLIMARGYKDYKYYSKTLLKVINVFAIISWVGGRLIVFPACCVYPSLVATYDQRLQLTALEEEVILMPNQWMGFMLFFLQGLQIFWSYYICKAFVEINVSAKIAANTYE